MRVIGAGVFGLSAALALHRRGVQVEIVEQGAPPDPRAASTDISKLVRMDYGSDGFYAGLMERAMPAWEADPHYHGVGIAVLARAPLAPGSFEGDSWRTLTDRGHALARTDGRELGWRGYRDGYVNPRAGWAASGEVVAELARRARAAAIPIRRGRAKVEAPCVVAAGAWTPRVLPELADRIATVGQPVFHLRPDDPERFRPPRFLPFAADVANTGWYGFPANHAGIVKIANHGPGRAIDPDAERSVDPGWEERLREFLDRSLPELADAPLVGTRLCLYADSFDGDFFICPHPDRPGVVVASGGSGHGFKFAPILGDLIADAAEGRVERRFRWRERGVRRTEDARHDG